MIPRDTTAGAHAAQIDALRKLGPAGRFEQAVAASELVRDLARQGIRRRHPNYDEATVLRALVWLTYGEGWARRIWQDGAAPP